MALSLLGKTAIVTGSTRGIGKTTAKYLAEAGANVVVSGRSEQSTWELPGSLSETKQEIEALGGTALAVKADLASDEDLRTLVEKTLAAFGRIDILINNAAIVGPRVRFFDGNADLLDLSYRVNVRAPFVLAQLVGPSMVQNGGGTIINVSSGAARNPDPPIKPLPQFEPSVDPVYGISKAALNRLTTSYAPELLADGISLVTVVPGLTATERMLRNTLRPSSDLSKADSTDVTAKAIMFVLQDPQAFAGCTLEAREVVSQNGL